MSIMKNINKAKVMVLKDQVSYQEGQIVSKTLVQNESVSITLFAFDKGEEISTHESGGDHRRRKIRTPRRRIHRHAGKTSACSVWQRAV